jgi:signal transduction histidine kinase/ligand-binding sensor domain-containing protein
LIKTPAIKKYLPGPRVARFLLVYQILTGLFFYCCQAQDAAIKFNLVEGDNGKALGQINAITQDPHGYMWFSGQGANCLYKYDGTHMTAYRHDSLNQNSLSGATHMETVYADKNGLIWIGFFFSGLDQFNPETRIFRHFINDPNDSNSISPGSVNVILRDHLGRLWVGTQNGLDLMDEKTGKFTHYRNNPQDNTSLSCNIVRAIYEDRNNILWVGTGFEFDIEHPDEGGLNRMEPNGSFVRFKHDAKNSNSLVNNKVRAICEDSRGNFWIGTAGDGLHIMNREKGTFKRYPYNPAHPDELSRPALKNGVYDPITFIREDAGGAVWIGTYSSGLSRYDTNTKKITRYNNSNGYPEKSCFQSWVSRDGVLWLTSTDLSSFLYRVEPSFEKLNQIFTGAPIKTIYEDNQGILWTTGFSKGLVRYDQNKKPVHELKSFASDSIDLFNIGITSMYQYQRDSLWLCSQAGIVLFDKKKSNGAWFTYHNRQGKNEKFNNKFVFHLIEDSDHSKWIGTSEGLFHISRENVLIKQYQPVAGDSNTINSRYLSSVLKDDSNIWVGNYKGEFNGFIVGVGGVNRLNKYSGRLRHFLDGISITQLYKDSDGTIWAGTEKGLYRYDKKLDRFSAFLDVRTGLTGENIVDVIEDDGKNFWVVTESAILKLNGDKTQSFVYGKKYGIRSATLVQGGICKTSKGEILIGNNTGFYVFSPAQLTGINKPLQLNITGFFVNSHEIFPGSESILLHAIEETSDISLEHNQNNFSFSFAAIDYRSPESNKYYTLLENYDSNWREAGGDKTAYYLNVPPGKNLFKVRAVNIDGINAEKTIHVSIDPPWWKTTWAYAIYALLLIAAFFVVDRFQKQRTIRRERQKAQVKELAQAKEIERAYTELKITQSQLIQSEKMASLGELTAGIAHEIQNPLNFVNNFSEVNKELLTEMREEMDKGNLETAKEVSLNISLNEDKINHHGKRADAIVKGMLLHSRVSAGQKEPTDINQLADEYLRLAYHGIRARDKSFNVTMKTDFDRSIDKMNVVPQDIGRVLLNLYNNAFYAVAEKAKGKENKNEPTVEVTTKKAANNVEIKVKDNGNGIPQKVLDKIFQPFFTTKPTGEGTGLGLSLSYDVIKAHGGEIRVNTKEGEFTEFVIQIPYT